jgi:hypothetical protein
MGGTIGKPQQLSRQQLLQNTTNTQKIINDMFQIMISQLTPEDFLKLGNPSQCKQFVFMMADSIQKTFVALKLQPKTKSSSGIVLFEEGKRLQQENPQTRNLCLYIAYFYIRIFQIFGALAISVLDDPNAGPILSTVSRYPIQSRSGFLTRKQKPQFGVRQQGGEADTRTFQELSSLFNIPSKFTIGRTPVSQYTFKENPNFIVIVPTKPNLKLNLDNNVQIIAHLIPQKYASRSTTTLEYKLSFSDFQYNDPYMLNKAILPRINNQLRTFKREINIISEDNGRTWISINSRSIVDEIQAISNEIQSIVQELERGGTSRIPTTSVPQSLPRRYPSTTSYPSYVPSYAPSYPSYTPSSSTSSFSPFVPKALQYDYIVNTLKSLSSNKPIAFCVARAMQLLDADTIFQQKSQPATSGICFKQFESRPTSTPEVGKTLDKMIGLRSLDHLYYTNPVISQDKSQVLVAKNDVEEYANFLKTISGLFGKQLSTTVDSIDKIQATGVSECGTTAIKQYLAINDPKSIAMIMKVIGNLFSNQLIHTQVVLKFFRERLFKIYKTKNPVSGALEFKYTIHPKLLEGGLNELANVSKEARKILLNYYTNCEQKYQEGVKLVLQSKYSTQR